MDAQTFKRLSQAMMAQDNDAFEKIVDAFESQGVHFEDALYFAYTSIDILKRPAQVTQAPAPQAAASTIPATGAVSSRFGAGAAAPAADDGASVPAEATMGGGGLPDFHSTPDTPGVMTAHARGDVRGQTFMLSQTIDVPSCEEISHTLKDAVVAAIISKTTLKLKLVDIKDSAGNVTSCQIQAVYARDNIAPVTVWESSKGEAGIVIAVLRRALSYASPDVVG